MLRSLSIVIAATAAAAQAPHTIHNVTTVPGEEAKFKWHCCVGALYETMHFVDPQNKLVTCFDQAPGMPPQQFGMVLDGNPDFDATYHLTCVSHQADPGPNPQVVFVIGAHGPADPNIDVVSRNKAIGYWKSTGVGENYWIGNAVQPGPGPMPSA